MVKRNIVSFVLRAKNRLKVLQALSEGQKISAQIEKQTKMYKSHVSRTLKELISKKLIRCMNPQDRNYRFYLITLEGKEALSNVKLLLKDIK
jgi:DNA-binding MarR family transcriptional regulator